jgi:tripartite-type tricarboxylate transporter receptor subunit TctC
MSPAADFVRRVTYNHIGGSGGTQTQREMLGGYMHAIIMHQTEIVALIERARARASGVFAQQIR